MHTPDGFVTGWICILMILLSSAGIAYSAFRLRHALERRKIISMSLLGAVIFAAQMLNFPIASGTSGHLIGAALATIMLGPHAAVIVIAAVLGLQTLAFGDGGLLASGVNIFNMALIGCHSAHFVYERIRGSTGVLLSSWASVFAASVSASALLALSGIGDFAGILFAMASVHAVIGIGEALITLGVFTYLSKAPGAFRNASLAVGTAMMLLVLLPFASGHPDGMEKVAINLGFFEKAISVYEAPFAEYLAFGSELAAGYLGMLMAFAVIYGTGFIIKAADRKQQPEPLKTGLP